MMKLELTFRPAEEGGNLPLSFRLMAPQMITPHLECGFLQDNPVVHLHRCADGAWIGDANVHGRLRGTALLSIILKDVSAPRRYWKGALSLEFVGKIGEQFTVNVVGVKNDGENSGMAQANSVHINLHQPEASRNGSSDASWQRIEVALVECESVSMPIPVVEHTPAKPATSASVPVSHAAEQTPPPTQQRGTSPTPDQSAQAHPHPEMSTIARGNSMIIGCIAFLVVAVLAFLLIYDRIDNRPALVKVEEPIKKPSDEEKRQEDKKDDSDKRDKPLPAQDHAPTISLRGLKPSYKNGEFLSFSIKLKQPGYLRIISHVSGQQVDTLYPCKVDTPQLLPAGEWIDIPDSSLIGVQGFNGHECYLLNPQQSEKTTLCIQWCPAPFLDDVTSPAGLLRAFPEGMTLAEAKTRGVAPSFTISPDQEFTTSFEVVP